MISFQKTLYRNQNDALITRVFFFSVLRCYVKSVLSIVFHSKIDSIAQNYIDIMKWLLMSLLFLTFGTQLIMELYFYNTMSEKLRYIAFVPAYLTLLCSYILLKLQQTKLAVHFFLLGMIVDQYLIMSGFSGPVTYVYVSYTNVVLVAGIILGPTLGIVYTILVVLVLSLYFYLAREGIIEKLSLEDIPYGSEMELLATIACFLFTGLTIYYSVFKMERLYISAVEEKQKADVSYQAMKAAQFRNEIRATHGMAIGELSQRIVQFKKIRDYVQITTEEIQKILQIDVALILLPNHQVLQIQGFATAEKNVELDINQRDVFSIEHPNILDMIKSLLLQESFPEEILQHSYAVPLFDSNQDTGWIIVFSEIEFPVPLEEFLTTISGILTSSFYRTKAEEQLRQSQKMETIGLLAGGVAHDFNNVLTAILGNAEVASTHIQSPNVVKTHLEQITRASTHAASLTHKLLTLTKKSIHIPTVVNVNTILQEMEPMLHPLFSPNMELKIQYSMVPPYVYMDQKDLESMVLNVMLNAKDALQSTGCVEIIVSVLSSKQAKKANIVQIEVRDDGIGMTPEVQQKLFEPFFTTKSEGTGLGLTMVHSIVQEAKGEIFVDSHDGEGSYFIIQFPYNQHMIKAQKISEHPNVYKERGHKTILVVDDNNDVRNMILEIISMSGYDSVGVSSGKQALQMLQKQNIDFILSDSIMPECTGVQLFEKIREEHREKQISFALMTGFLANLEECKDIIIVEKPISSPELLHIFDHVLLVEKISS
jgi:signal transduction histidine kinase